jgi:hypothetical protein
MTRISLLATAMSLPASIAARAGLRPPVPTMAMRTRSASGRVARDGGLGAGGAEGGVGELGGEGLEFGEVAIAGEADDLHAVGDVAGDFGGALADGTGGTQDYDAALSHGGVFIIAPRRGLPRTIAGTQGGASLCPGLA